MDEEFVIQPAEPLEEGLVYLLSLQFKGTIEEEAVGLYRTKYIDNDNESRYQPLCLFQSFVVSTYYYNLS